MAKEMKRICDGLGENREVALSYLEGFEWKLDEAMEACRNKTPPPAVVRVKSTPGVPVNEKSAVDESSATRLDVTPLQILSQAASILREKQRPRSKVQLINSFLEVAVGESVEDATAYLERYNWDVKNALFAFSENRHLGFDRSTNEGLNLGVFSMDVGAQTYPQGFSGGYHSVIGNWNSQQHRPWIDPSTISDRKIPPGRYSIVRSNLQASLDNTARSDSSMETSVKEADNEHTLVDIPVMASSQVQTENIPDPTGRICVAHEVSRDEAMEGSNWNLKAAITKTLQQLPQLSDEDMSLFCNITGRNHKIALYCLNICNGDVEKAIGYCFDQGFPKEFLEDVTTSKPTEESKSKVEMDTTSTTIEIRLADETTLKISLGSDQTVRDIRKAIEELRPDITRENYSLTSVANVDCSDLNMTVDKIASDGYATLIQMFLD